LFCKYHAAIGDHQNLYARLHEAVVLTARFFMDGDLNRRLAKRYGTEKVDEILKNMENRYREASAI
jgi:hypothetical protein